MAETSKLQREKHVKYFQRMLRVIPGHYASLDTHRMTIAFFALSGLDLLGALHEIEDDKLDIIEWIYSLQVLPNSSGTNSSQCGFRGSSTMGHSFYARSCQDKGIPYDSGHVTMTYTALASLLILGDNLGRVDRKAVVEGLRSLQQPDGSFSCVPEGSETDMRFVYCACCVSYMLNDWSGMDTSKTISYITNSLSYEGGMGQGPGAEAHGGPTFCSVASLCLMEALDSSLSAQQQHRLKRWCIFRQESGFQGRPNKPVDTCYSFWIGATLQLLGVLDLTNFLSSRSFVLSTQSLITGGLAKWPDTTPDPLHTYLGLCGLALMGEPGLATVHPALNITQRASDHLANVQKQWHNDS
ncbi:geranylgeranyl transferase type-1 subunit beta-like [Babylonia areolata]|uniref:geranylgeranyl transferase type-1 subunit beta-like n=1 Tax=Babylonia areolata TaxID=304850 RepID=UPI003FD44935